MSELPPGTAPPPVGSMGRRRRNWIVITFLVLVLLCICCVVFGYFGGDTGVRFICQNVPGLFDPAMCRAVGVP